MIINFAVLAISISVSEAKSAVAISDKIHSGENERNYYPILKTDVPFYELFPHAE